MFTLAIPFQFTSVQSLSCVWLFATQWTTVCQAFLPITNSWSLFNFMSIELVMSSNHLILFHPLLLLSSLFPTIRVFTNESGLCTRWPNYWSFSFSISPEYSGLISITSNLPWFMNITFQVPMQYCSYSIRLPSPVTSTTGCCCCFGTISSFFLELFLHSSPGAY